MDKEARLDGEVTAGNRQEDGITSLIKRAWQVGARDPQRALALSQEAYNMAREDGVQRSGEAILSSLINLGRFHYELSQLDRAQERLEEALTLVHQGVGEGEDPAFQQSTVSKIYMGMGLIRWRLGDYAAALERLLLALDMVRKNGDKPAEANLLSNIGMVYGVIGEHQHAMNVYRQALEIYESHRERSGYGMALNNSAMVCIQAEEYAQALNYARSSLKVAREVGHRSMETNALDSAGAAYMGLGRFDEAFEHFEKSAALAKELGDRHDELAAWIHMGQLYARKNDMDEARSALQRALSLAEDLDDTEQIRQCHQTLAQLFKEQGHFEQALAHYEQYHACDRAIYRERAAMRFKTLQVVHETQTARQEAEMANFRTARLEKEIEERSRIEAALRTSEERFRLLLEESPIGVHIYAPDGQLIHCNRAWKEMWGREGTDWDSYNILEGGAIDRLDVRAQVERAFKGESVRIPEVELSPEKLGKQTGARWLRAQAYSLLDESGQLKNVVLMIEDITEQRRSDEAVRLAQKMESLGALAGGVAHDFNNLLVAMLGQASLAMKLLPDGHLARSHVQKAMRAAEQAADLTQQMLAYSGHGHFTVRAVDLNSLISDRVNLWQAAISHRISLRLDLQPGIPSIDGDASQIQQMILNLVLNSAESAAQTGRIIVSTALMEISGAERDYWRFTGRPLERGVYLSLKVSDEGGGIPAEHLSHIFDPFFTTKEQGRGLGLAAVLGIVRGHNAGLAVYNNNGDSEQPDGTVFEILFPVSSRFERDRERGHTIYRGGGRVQGAVLVIDDEVMVREAVADILMMDDIPVILASSGQEGLEVYRQRGDEVELVLLDLSMPGMSGEETYRRLREIDAQARVLISSGYSAGDVAIHFDDDGPAGFLQKPYSISVLLDEVRRHFVGVE